MSKGEEQKSFWNLTSNQYLHYFRVVVFFFHTYFGMRNSWNQQRLSMEAAVISIEQPDPPVCFLKQTQFCSSSWTSSWKLYIFSSKKSFETPLRRDDITATLAWSARVLVWLFTDVSCEASSCGTNRPSTPLRRTVNTRHSVNAGGGGKS